MLTMLTGQVVKLRQIRENDLDYLWERHADIADRGIYFPIGVMSQPKFRSQFSETGFWTREEGTLVMVDETDQILGHIEFFPTVNYLDELELSYQVYGKDNRGKGIATEAVGLLTRYLFERTKYNRIRLIIHPDNAASRRVAEKAGYQYEGLARGAWYNRGQNHDVAVYAILKDEVLNSED